MAYTDNLPYRKTMENVDSVSRRILDLVPGGTTRLHGIRYNIATFTVEFARLCKNIKETSITESDRLIRCEALAKDSGIDKSFIILLTA